MLVAAIMAQEGHSGIDARAAQAPELQQVCSPCWPAAAAQGRPPLGQAALQWLAAARPEHRKVPRGVRKETGSHCQHSMSTCKPPWHPEQSRLTSALIIQLCFARFQAAYAGREAAPRCCCDLEAPAGPKSTAPAVNHHSRRRSLPSCAPCPACALTPSSSHTSSGGSSSRAAMLAPSGAPSAPGAEPWAPRPSRWA